MKSFLKMTLIGSAIVLALAGCDEKKPEANTSHEATPIKSSVNNDQQNNDNAKQYDQKTEAYAVGVSIGSNLKDNLDFSKVTLDSTQISKGFEDALKDKVSYSKQEIKDILKGLDERLTKEAEERFTAKKEENVAAGDKFREEFAAQSGVKKTDSGLLYQIEKEGDGPHPTANDTVIVHYVGTLVDGQKFDSSYDRGETTKFPLNQVIRGWTEGIQLIGVGGKIKLVVPPELAYGDQEKPSYDGKADITPASTLIFEVELLGIDGKDEPSTSSADTVE